MAGPKEITLSRTKAHIYSHIRWTPPYPTQTFTGQTIIVTGSNTGMGLEAARHFIRLDAALVILAVRNLEKGEAAKASILASPHPSPAAAAAATTTTTTTTENNKKQDRVQVWELDLASHASVTRFAARVDRELDRLDILVSNAGMYVVSSGFRRAQEGGGDEATVAVNVVGTLLLAVLLLPKLRATGTRFDKEVVCTFTGSFVHFMTDFPERKADDIFAELAVEERARMSDRYNVTKLIELLLVRQLARRITASSQPGRITVSILNPGAVLTDIMREGGLGMRLFIKFLTLIGMFRTAEEGGRTLVSAAEGGEETHGQYLDNCTIGQSSQWVRSEEGEKVGQQLWTELSKKLEAIQPGIMNNI